MLKLVLDELVSEAGVKPLLHASVFDVRRSGRHMPRLDSAHGLGGRREFDADGCDGQARGLDRAEQGGAEVRFDVGGREGAAPWITSCLPSAWMARTPAGLGSRPGHRRVITISRYSLGTMTASSPERLKWLSSALMSLSSAD